MDYKKEKEILDPKILNLDVNDFQTVTSTENYEKLTKEEKEKVIPFDKLNGYPRGGRHDTGMRDIIRRMTRYSNERFEKSIEFIENRNLSSKGILAYDIIKRKSLRSPKWDLENAIGRKLALIGAVNNKGREQNYENALLKEMEEHKQTWTGWTFPLKEDKKRILEDYISKGEQFNFYFYSSIGGGGSGLVEYRLQIDDFKFNSNGMNAPSPEICCKDDLDNPYRGWFHISLIEKLMPPLSLEKFQQWDDTTKKARALQNTFEYVNDVSENDNILHSREEVDQAISLIGKKKYR